MTEMSAQDWITEIDRGLAYRKIYGREDAWRKNETNYLNDPSSHAARGPNLVFEMGDTILSATGMFDPEFVVTPEHPAGVTRGPIVESVDNYLARKLKLAKHIRRSSQHSYLYNRAILKIGYDSEFGWSPRLDIGKIGQPLGMSMSQFHPKTGLRIETKDVTPGMPWISSLLPHDFVVPWGTIELDDAPWAVHRFIRLNEDIKADRKYINTGDLKPNMSIEDFVYSYLYSSAGRTRATPTRRPPDAGKERPHSIYNELWEIHDRRDMTVKVVCRDYNKFLRKEPDAVMLACGMPFVSGTFVEHPRSFWGTPLAYYLGQLQAEQYDISTQNQKQRRISILRFIAAKGFMDPDKLQKLVSGDVGAIEFAEVMDGLKDKLIPVPIGNLLDFTMQSNQVRQDARSMIGTSRNQSGEFDTGTRRTKGEAMLVAQGSARRQTPRMQMVRDLYLDTITKLNKVIFSYWTFPRSVMVGRDWARFTGKELAGDYLYDINLAQNRDLSRAESKVESMMMTAKLKPMLQGQDPNEIFGYLSDAANDPAFERLLGFVRGKRGGGGQGGQGGSSGQGQLAGAGAGAGGSS